MHKKGCLKFAAASAALILGTVSLGRAETINLATGNGGTATAAIGGSYSAVWVDQQTTGTGVIEPFLRVQSNTLELGYNLDSGTPFDTKAGTWTHAIQVSDIPTVNIGGTLYRQFLLDINQNSGQDNELLSLNQVQLFLSASGAADGLLNLASTNPYVWAPGAGFTEIFRMSGVGAVDVIELDYSRNAGSGSGDMFLYINNNVFTGSSAQYLTMFTEFGSPGAHTTNDGFEEWAFLKGATTVPEPSSLLLLGTGLIGIFAAARSKFRKQ